jgi:hypothetical protein
MKTLPTYATILFIVETVSVHVNAIGTTAVYIIVVEATRFLSTGSSIGMSAI